MAGRIPQDFIDNVLSRIDIVDIIDSRVPLRKAGRDFQACCPFHNEKSPSFTVSQTKQFYHCFGCGAHGTAISFLMEFDRMEFRDAIEELAKQAGLELPKTDDNAPQQKTDNSLYDLMQQAAQFYRQQLRLHPQAIDYLKQRGLSGEIAADFGIGFAPPGWDSLGQALAQNNSRKTEQLVTNGMLIRNDQGRCYDRFRNRIMFPIRDRRGRVIAFGGRVIDPEDKPKYLNSPESPLFHKGRELYGLFEARQAARHIERLLVVEGYMDVVALAQHGIRNAVATLGTALTSDHLQPLFRTTQEVVFCFDGDRAGRDAAWKALDIVLPEIQDGRQARFMFLPDGEDPDTLVRKIGHEAFDQLVRQAKPLSSFLLEGLSQQVDMSSIDGRSRLGELARTKLSRVQNQIYRHMLIGELANHIRIDRNDLMTLLGEKSTTQATLSPSPGKREPRKLSLVRTAITLLLNQPQLAQTAGDPQRLRQIAEPGINILVELLEILQQQPNLSCGAILEKWRQRPEGAHLGKLARTPCHIPADGLGQEFSDTLRSLEKLRLEQEYSELLRKSQAGGGLDDHEKTRLRALLAEKGRLGR